MNEGAADAAAIPARRVVENHFQPDAAAVGVGHRRDVFDFGWHDGRSTEQPHLDRLLGIQRFAESRRGMEDNPQPIQINDRRHFGIGLRNEFADLAMQARDNPRDGAADRAAVELNLDAFQFERVQFQLFFGGEDLGLGEIDIGPGPFDFLVGRVVLAEAVEVVEPSLFEQRLDLRRLALSRRFGFGAGNVERRLQNVAVEYRQDVSLLHELTLTHDDFLDRARFRSGHLDRAVRFGEAFEQVARSRPAARQRLGAVIAPRHNGGRDVEIEWHGGRSLMRRGTVCRLRCGGRLGRRCHPE